MHGAVAEHLDLAGWRCRLRDPLAFNQIVVRQRLIQTGTLVRSWRRCKERGIWHRRYWEHTIREERNLAIHVDYVYWNPIKHGYVSQVIDWPHSTIHRYVKHGVY